MLLCSGDECSGLPMWVSALVCALNRSDASCRRPISGWGWGGGMSAGGSCGETTLFLAQILFPGEISAHGRAGGVTGDVLGRQWVLLMAR